MGMIKRIVGRTTKYNYDITINNIGKYMLDNINSIVNIINKMDSIFFKSPKISSNNLVLYRGLIHTPPYCKVDLYDVKAGDTINIPTYMSCSSNYDISETFSFIYQKTAKCIMLIIRNLEGCPFIYLPWNIMMQDKFKHPEKKLKSGEMLNASEHEYLLPRGCSFKVNKVYMSKSSINIGKYGKSEDLLKILKKKFGVGIGISDENISGESGSDNNNTVDFGSGIVADEDKDNGKNGNNNKDNKSTPEPDNEPGNIMSGGKNMSDLTPEQYSELEKMYFKDVKIIDISLVSYVNHKDYIPLKSFTDLNNFNFNINV
jgi:hypothetical protein